MILVNSFVVASDRPSPYDCAARHGQPRGNTGAPQVTLLLVVFDASDVSIRKQRGLRDAQFGVVRIRVRAAWSSSSHRHAERHREQVGLRACPCAPSSTSGSPTRARVRITLREGARVAHVRRPERVVVHVGGRCTSVERSSGRRSSFMPAMPRVVRARALGHRGCGSCPDQGGCGRPCRRGCGRVRVRRALRRCDHRP